MKKLLFISIMFFTCLFAKSQTANPNHQWFVDARFGMFIHFGPYSVLADGEWILETRPLKFHNYKNLQKLFNPQAFDAKEWVRIAKNAGMKYITFTSRHHDGFSMWDTKQSEWNIMNTPYGKDLIKELADECRKEGIKLSFYYSLLDWGRNDYSYWTGRTGQHSGRTERGEWQSYINFMKAQLTELLTNYGEIAGIWFDGEWDQMAEENQEGFGHEYSKVDWHFDEIYSLIHTLQPNCMIGNNHHLPPLAGEDFQAFEKDLPGENIGGGFSAKQTVTNALPLETCETINRTWGYNMRDENYKSSKELVHLLVRAAGYGANLLLNVGPMPNGEFQDECITRLANMGKWTSAYGTTIYGTQAGVVKPQSWGAATQKGNKHYIHILNSSERSIVVRFPEKIKSARWLNIDTKLVWKRNRKTGDVTFDLTNVPMDEVNSIIEVEM
ncbi:MAG: alpha-L-fucosidase [Cytophagaceae bacterium]|jgi:alpha-L-fucosidase|nr:alpha-L-fucosidase [Cytophagaceae bacterium]